MITKPKQESMLVACMMDKNGKLNNWKKWLLDEDDGSELPSMFYNGFLHAHIFTCEKDSRPLIFIILRSQPLKNIPSRSKNGPLHLWFSSAISNGKRARHLCTFSIAHVPSNFECVSYPGEINLHRWFLPYSLWAIDLGSAENRK